MKYDVDCPHCGSRQLQKARMSQSGDGFWCIPCDRFLDEETLLRHMRDKPGMNRHAPAFWRLDLKPKARSEAAKAVFG